MRGFSSESISSSLAARRPCLVYALAWVDRLEAYAFVYAHSPRLRVGLALQMNLAATPDTAPRLFSALVDSDDEFTNPLLNHFVRTQQQ